VERNEFIKIRNYLGKSQSEMAQLLGCSIKSVQSFEQGRRKIPMSIERQALLLLHVKKPPEKRYKPCWAIIECCMENRAQCPAWEFQAGHICWFINGTICHGKKQGSWQKKMEMCRQCEVFKSLLPD
jgi:DNA-binding XRE family transcriptional regulator